MGAGFVLRDLFADGVVVEPFVYHFGKLFYDQDDLGTRGERVDDEHLAAGVCSLIGFLGGAGGVVAA